MPATAAWEHAAFSCYKSRHFNAGNLVQGLPMIWVYSGVLTREKVQPPLWYFQQSGYSSVIIGLMLPMEKM